MKKFAIVSLLFAGASLLYWQPANAQQKVKPAGKQAKPGSASPKGKLMADGYTMLESGLQYKIVKHGTGKRHPALGDHLEMNIHVHIKDSTMFDSRKMNNNKPVPFVVQPPNFKGDPIEGFMLLVAGDSALMKLPVDSLVSQGKQLMPGMKAGDVLEYDVVLISVVADAEFKKEADGKVTKQKAIDDKILQTYFKTNKLTPKKTASGLYYTISSPGDGPVIAPGQTAMVNYTGRLMDGKIFDCNTDPQFKHVEPLAVEVGKGRVIKGWDEGLALLKVGSKATFYIPSGLAYGPQDRSPQIPANSILVFDVEIMSIQTQADIDRKKADMEKKSAEMAKQQIDADDKIIRDYLAKNSIKATKTASGLYYSIKKEGSGDSPKPGDKVSVKYQGMTVEGKKFDGNMDSTFHHTDPFEFPLGKGQVIRGWDEGIGLLKKGSKGTLYIPSGMAYGSHSPTPMIPNNAVLIFDVELIDFTKQ